MSFNRPLVVLTAWFMALAFSAPQQAQAAPDFEQDAMIQQAAGAFTVTKHAQVYLDNNPDDPFPGDGDVTYVYSLDNAPLPPADPNSPLGINRFVLDISANCPINSIGFFGGVQDPDAPGGEFVPPADPNGSVQWNWAPPNTIAPGSSSSEVYVTSPCGPGDMPDTLVSFGGEFGFDEQGLCLGPMVPGADCELDLMKFCEVPEIPGGTGDDCQGKVVQMKLLYTGENCGGSATQNGKFECADGAGSSEPVSVVVTDKASEMTVAPAVIDEDDVLVITATGVDLPSSTKFDLLDGANTLHQSLNIHTSCSAPLNVGDKLGGFVLQELTTTDGGTVALPDPNAAPTNICSIPLAPEGTPCDGKPSAISLRYVGGSCADTTETQEGSLSCGPGAGDAGMISPVQIVVFKDGDPGTQYLDTGAPADVALSDVVDALASTAGESLFSSSTTIQILDGAGFLLQELDVHTSCSKPLAIGDRFGAVQVVGLDNFAFGEDVNYVYKVTNPNTSGIINIDVTDIANDVIPVPVMCPMTTLGPGEMMECTSTQFIFEDTTNIATLTATDEDGNACVEAKAGAAVTADEVDVGKKKKAKKKAKKKKKVKKKTKKSS